MTQWKKRTRQEIEKIVNDLDYILLDEYTEERYRKVVVQNSEGYKWDGFLTNFMRTDQKISFFNVGNPKTLENITVWLKINNRDLELCKGNIYISAKTSLMFYHNISECQEESKISWDDLSHGGGCPVCSGKQIGKRNSLAYLRPDLIKEWHPENESNPSGITCGSGKKAYWICSECGYGQNKEWFVYVYSRTSGVGCPACARKVATDKNRLSILFSEIADEWDYSKNKDTPNDVCYGSDKRRWWICKKEHSYYSKISSRTNLKSGCPICNNSKGEDRILWWIEANALRLNNIEIIKHTLQKSFPNCRNKRPLEFDFGFEYKNGSWSMMEYHGPHHYKPIRFSYSISENQAKENLKTQKKRDKIKETYCKKNNIPFLIIPYWEFDNIEKILEQTFFG